MVAAWILLAIFFIAGCAHPAKQKDLNDAKIEVWTGRLSLQIQSEPVQFFSAGFELKGQAEKGELTLTSPLGNVLGRMRWSQGQAELESGGEVKRFASLNSLLEETTGAALPLAALFDWLEGKNTVLNGWTADLSQHSQGRIAAKRADPAPQADLRIILDQ